MSLRLQLAGLGALALSALQMSQPIDQSCVVDEAVRDPSLVTYRSQLLQVIRERSVEQLKPLVDSDVFLPFQEHGWEKFVEVHRPQDPESDIWSRLHQDVSRGGRFMGKDGFCAPYFMCPEWPGADGQDVLVIVKRNVPVRQRPDDSARVLAVLSCDILRVPSSQEGPEHPPGWETLLLPNGSWGFLRAGNVILAETWVHFERKSGRWQLTQLAAID